MANAARVFAAISALSLLLPNCAELHGQQRLTPQQLFKKVSPSVFAVEIYDGSELVARGSSVACATFTSLSLGPFHEMDRIAHPDLSARAEQPTDVLVMSYHVVQLGHKSLREPTYVVTNGTESRPAFLAAVDTDDDLAWIVVPGLRAPRVLLRESSTIPVGERVLAVGSPLALDNSISEGIVSGIRQDGTKRLIQTTAPISAGSSGGGLFDAFGNLVGITQFTMRDGQNINFAISAERIAFFEAFQDQIVQRGYNLAAHQDAAALSACNEALRIASDRYRRASAELCFAYFFLQAGEPKGAEGFAKAAVENSGKMAGAHYMLGTVYEGVGQDQDAVSEYQIASRLDPSTSLYQDALEKAQKKVPSTRRPR